MQPCRTGEISAANGAETGKAAGGGGLLDYVVELGLAAMNDITAEAGIPPVLTDAAGFANAKSQPRFFSTGELFVIPLTGRPYYRDLELDLFVNGDLRQRAHPSEMVRDATALIEQVLAVRDRTWDSDGMQTPITPTPGVISRGAIIQSGTPEGVSYRAPDTRPRVLGFTEYIGSSGTNADSIVDSALRVYVRDAHEAGVYLQPGDAIVARAEGLGQISRTSSRENAPRPRI